MDESLFVPGKLSALVNASASSMIESQDAWSGPAPLRAAAECEKEWAAEGAMKRCWWDGERCQCAGRSRPLNVTL
jgi:hypothetical protein